MDLFSITVPLFFHILHLTGKLLSTCYSLRQEFKDPPKDLLKLILELTGLQHIVETWTRMFEFATDEDRSLATVRLLGQAGGPLETCTNELDHLVGQFESESSIGIKAQRKSRWKLPPKAEVNRFILVVHRCKENLALALTADHLILSLAIQDDLNAITRSLAAITIDEQRQKELLHWLSAPDSSSNHNRAREIREPSTGSWFTQGRHFLEWLSIPSSVIWLYGIPGSGKTILCSKIIDELLLRGSTRPRTAVAYFYFDFVHSKKQDTESLVRSLVKQLSLQGALKSALPGAQDYQALNELYKRCQFGQRQPSMGELLDTLRSILKASDETYIVIDAVDECKEIDYLLKFFQRAITWKLESFHLLITSRPESSIKSFFDSSPAITITIDISSNDDDIITYIHERLWSDPRLKKWPLQVQKEIETRLVQGANGMFRWVVCQLDALRNCLKLDALRRVLNSLPETLDETYERILCNIDKDYASDAKKILQWLTYSNRPLKMEEIAEVVAIDTLRDPQFDPQNRLADPRDLLVICSSLVVTSSVRTRNEYNDLIETEELRLAHFSVKEYLVSYRIQTGSAAEYSIIQPEANTAIAEACIGYLFSISASDLLSDDFQSLFPLSGYASHEWHYHVRQAPQKENLDQLDKMVEQLLDPAYGHLVNWLRMFDPDMPWNLTLNPHKTKRETCSALYYASSLGLNRAVTRLLRQGADVNCTGGSLGSPLQAAAYHGHSAIVTLLLENKANCLARCGHYGTALQAAKFARRQDIVEILEKYDKSQISNNELTSHIHLLADEKAPFEVLDSLGGGGSGIVEKVRVLTDGRICVRKTCKTPTHSARKSFLQEVRIMQKLHHLHVVEVLGSYSRGKTSSILLLPVADKDLGDFMDELNVENVEQTDLLIKWIACLVEGLRYIHSQNIKHKDIKPQNLLVHGDKILYTDFGIAHDFEGRDSVTAGQTGMTRRYSAPEVVSGDERSRYADVFSLGCVFLEMLGAIFEWRLEGFDDEDDYATYIQDNRSGVSDSLNGLIPAARSFETHRFSTFYKAPEMTLSMLDVEPQKRPKALAMTSALSLQGPLPDGTYRCC